MPSGNGRGSLQGSAGTSTRRYRGFDAGDITVILRLAIVTVALTAAAGLGFASGTTAATRPVLRIADDLPLTLRGTSFRSGERVRVTVHMGTSTLVRTTRPGRRGGFTVRFAGVRLNYCATPLTITARGARSGVVRARIPIRECAAP